VFFGMFDPQNPLAYIATVK